MKSIILYGSQYGSARRYALELSRQTGVPAFRYQDAPPISGQEMVVYIGALYAGSVLGLTKSWRGLSLHDGQKVVIATVGLADSKIPSIRDNIRSSLQKQLPSGLYERATFFHLQGAIDYQKLSFIHRTMMAMLHHLLQIKSAGVRKEEDRVLMETYGKQADFVDFTALAPIAEEIKRLRDSR